MSGAPLLRLDRLLANLGYGSRREIQEMARQGRITLAGEALRDVKQRVALTADLSARLSIDGEAADPLPGLVLMMNKPAGATCSHKEAGPLVYDLLPGRWRRREPAICSIGRLDKETSGLLLLTDDGAFLHRIISPRAHIPKRYLAELELPLRGNEAAVFASGQLRLAGEAKPLLPAELEVISPHKAAVTLYEGRYHQARRMFAAAGNRVLALHRTSVGGLSLPDSLEAGGFALLDTAQRASVLAGPALLALEPRI